MLNASEPTTEMREAARKLAATLKEYTTTLNGPQMLCLSPHGAEFIANVFAAREATARADERERTEKTLEAKLAGAEAEIARLRFALDAANNPVVDPRNSDD